MREFSLVGEMESLESLYMDLLSVPAGVRPRWLREHAPTGARGSWWLALIEQAELGVSRARCADPSLPVAELEIVVELIDLAELDGMPAHYAASRLALTVSGLLDAGLDPRGGPQVLHPEALARRILSSFRLDQRRAVEVALQMRTDDQQVSDEDLRALRDLKWVLPDLGMLAPLLADEALLSVVDGWVALSKDLEE
jgi:hypothetical protein